MSVDKSNHPFFVQRPAVFTIDQLGRMEEAMMRILEEVGIAVLDDGVLEQLSSCGFSVKGNRVLVERDQVREFLKTERKANGVEATAELL
jgi:trimethylamine:corrinoid methyltransferase-like protein